MSIHRSWIFDDYDIDGMQHPSTPQTPQLYVKESTKLGDFLSLSAPARDRAMIHKQKQVDAASVKSNRRKSIFESIGSILLDSADELPPLQRTTSCNNSEVSDFEDSPRQRYQRRGSCTKFSLEHEILDPDDDASFYDEDEEPKFKSFRRNETLQGDDVFEDAFMDAPQQSPSPSLTTIDQMPVPFRRSTSGSVSSAPPARPSMPPLATSKSQEERTPPRSRSKTARRHSTQGSNHSQKSEKDTNSPLPVPKLRHVSSSPAGKRYKSPRQSSVRKSKNTTPTKSKQKLPHALPSAPFAHDSDHHKHSGHSTQTQTRTRSPSVQSRKNSKQRGSSRHGPQHEAKKTSPKRSSEGAPKFGSLLKRLHLHRDDSDKSFADETAPTDDGSCVSESTQRQVRRSSISAKKPAAEESPRQQTKKGLWRMGHNPLNGSNHSNASRQGSDHKRSWRGSGHKESDGNHASSGLLKKNLLPPTHKSTTTTLKTPTKLPRALFSLPVGSNHGRTGTGHASAQSSPVRPPKARTARRGSCQM